ncbi:hypothetical protein [Gardnerella vaginalis]|uniref:hypothetical protein n=1 Tax=Gardnerella TaxID=2701 RepID=UPI0015E084B1|nr:hypothetical protein [Gardnerella vaginalis]
MVKFSALKNRLPRMSSSASSAPAGRSSEKDARNRSDYSSSASQSHSRFENSKASILDHFNRVIAWSNRSMVPLFNIVIIVVFFVTTLTISLLIRTRMTEISFAQAQVQEHIVELRQSVEDKQTKLDSLEAQLPVRAQKMGMIPPKDTIAIDLSDYAKKGDKTKSKSKDDKSKGDKSKVDKSKGDKSKSKNDKTKSKPKESKPKENKPKNDKSKTDKSKAKNEKSKSKNDKTSNKTSSSNTKQQQPAKQEKR